MDFTHLTAFTAGFGFGATCAGLIAKQKLARRRKLQDQSDAEQKTSEQAVRNSLAARETEVAKLKEEGSRLAAALQDSESARVRLNSDLKALREPSPSNVHVFFRAGKDAVYRYVFSQEVGEVLCLKLELWARNAGDLVLRSGFVDFEVTQFSDDGLPPKVERRPAPLWSADLFEGRILKSRFDSSWAPKSEVKLADVELYLKGRPTRDMVVNIAWGCGGVTSDSREVRVLVGSAGLAFQELKASGGFAPDPRDAVCRVLSLWGDEARRLVE